MCLCLAWQDLEIIFSQFGKVKAEIIRDPITGDSLNYAFVEFDSVSSRLPPAAAHAAH